MKKIFILALAVLLIASLFMFVGCEKENNDKNSTTSAITSTQENTTTTTTAPTTTQRNPSDDDALTDKMVKDSHIVEYQISFKEKSLMDTRWEPDYIRFNSYEEYQTFCNELDSWLESQRYYYEHEHFADWSEYWGKMEKGIIDAFDKYTKGFFADNTLLIIENPTYMQVLSDTKLEEICINGNDLNVYIYEKSGGGVASSDYALFFIPIAKKDADKITNINPIINLESTSRPGMSYKPIIYLYPTEETEVDVTLGFKENITVSYPEYADGWSVIAKPDGKLVYTATGRNLYSLYYESENVVDFGVEKDGFVVKGEDTATFLEEKLAVLGLNEYEAEEFIIYWLPILQENEYNYIRFATQEEIERNMPLEINPNPDTVIRVLMTSKGLDAPIAVEEQQLTTPDRTGFVAVEWGGTIIK